MPLLFVSFRPAVIAPRALRGAQADAAALGRHGAPCDKTVKKSMPTV